MIGMKKFDLVTVEVGDVEVHRHVYIGESRGFVGVMRHLRNDSDGVPVYAMEITRSSDYQALLSNSTTRINGVSYAERNTRTETAQVGTEAPRAEGSGDDLSALDSQPPAA